MPKKIRKPTSAIPKARTATTKAPKKQKRDSLVPDISIAERYQGRKFGNFTEFDIYQRAMDSAVNILIEGPTGPGKTMSVMAFAAKNGLRFVDIPCNAGIDATQLFGKYIPDEENGGFKWVDGDVTRIVREGGVLLVNEVNFMPERVSTVLFGLFDSRRYIKLLDHESEIVRAHRPNCWCDLDEDECRSKWLLVVADMNPDYAGTRPLNAAFRNRFGIQLYWDYDPDVEAKLVHSGILLDIAKNLRSMHGQSIWTPLSTNMLMEFERMREMFDMDFAIENFVQHFDSTERNAVREVFKSRRVELDQSYAPDTEDDMDDDEDDEYVFEVEDNVWRMMKEEAEGVPA